MRILANGLHTDHPIPGLPFVDDSLIDPTDRHQIEAIGRKPDTGMWGRTDINDPAGEPIWRAFTTIPDHPDYAWAVRRHETQGVSIILIADEDTASFHSRHPQALTFRHGGYWTPDGTTWYRPFGQIDPLHIEPNGIPVPDGNTVYADTTLADFGNSESGEQSLYTVEKFARAESAGRDLTTASFPDWVRSHLSTWRAHRRPDDLDPAACIIDVKAPELDAPRLVAAPAVASMLGVSQGSIRAYVSRGQGEEPQFTNPARWSLPVVDHWARTRARSGVIVRPAMSEEVTERLVHMAEKIVRDAGPSVRRNGQVRSKDQARVAALVAHTLQTNVVGLSNGDVVLPGYIYAAWMIQKWEAISKERFFTGTWFGFPDIMIEHLCSLIFTNPIAAQTAVREFARYLVDEDGKTRDEAIHVLTAHPWLAREAYAEFITDAISPQTPVTQPTQKSQDGADRDEKYRAMCDQIAATVADYSDESTTPDQALKAYAGLTLQVDAERLPKWERLEHQMRQEILIAALAGTVTNAQVGNVRDRILNNVESTPHN